MMRVLVVALALGLVRANEIPPITTFAELEAAVGAGGAHEVAGHIVFERELTIKGWKLKGVVAALTAAEALAAGFTHEEYAAAAVPDATATRAAGSDVTGDEAGREEKGGEVVGE